MYRESIRARMSFLPPAAANGDVDEESEAGHRTSRLFKGQSLGFGIYGFEV